MNAYLPTGTVTYNVWSEAFVGANGPPPYIKVEDGQPQQLDGPSFLANFNRRFHFEIHPDFVTYIRFQCVPQATDDNPNPIPILFRRLEFKPQVQVLMSAGGIHI